MYYKHSKKKKATSVVREAAACLTRINGRNKSRPNEEMTEVRTIQSLLFQEVIRKILPQPLPSSKIKNGLENS